MPSSLPAVPDWLAPYSGLAADLAVFLAVATAVYLLGRVLVVPGVLRVRNRNNPTLVSASETYLAVLLAGVAVFAGLVATGQARALVNTDSAILVASLTFVFGVAGQEVFASLVSGVSLVADPDSITVQAEFWVADPAARTWRPCARTSGGASNAGSTRRGRRSRLPQDGGSGRP
jgi:hypothetical protein